MIMPTKETLRFMSPVMTINGIGYILGKEFVENKEFYYIIHSRKDFNHDTWVEKFSKYNGPCVIKRYPLEEVQ